MLDHYLQPHAKVLPSYKKDTSDFIKISETENIKHMFLVTLDVKSLYTTIPNHDGIVAAKEALNSVNKMPIATKVIVRFSLMSTICARNYANVFMGIFERTYIYPYMQPFANFCYQFINDLFLFWKTSEREFLHFTAKLNTCHP